MIRHRKSTFRAFTKTNEGYVWTAVSRLLCNSTTSPDFRASHLRIPSSRRLRQGIESGAWRNHPRYGVQSQTIRKETSSAKFTPLGGKNFFLLVNLLRKPNDEAHCRWWHTRPIIVPARWLNPDQVKWHCPAWHDFGSSIWMWITASQGS